MEEGPWVQAAHWLAARRGPRLVCHGQQAGLAPARAPRKAGASLDSGIRSPDRMARPQEGALSQGKAGPRGAAPDQPGPRVARGPEAKRRPFKAGPPWACEHICPEGRQSDRQTGRPPAWAALTQDQVTCSWSGVSRDSVSPRSKTTSQILRYPRPLQIWALL